MGYCLLQKNETFNDTIRIWSQKIQGQQSGSYWSFEDILITNTEEVIFYINDNRLSPVAPSNIWWVHADGTDALWSESVPDSCSRVTIRIKEDILLEYATQDFNLTVVFTAPGRIYDMDLVGDQEVFDSFLKDRGLKLKTQLTSSPRIFCDNVGKNWLLLSEDVDLIVSNGFPLNQTDNVDIYIKNESNYSLFQHPKTLIEEYYYIRLQSLNDIEESTLIPVLNNQNEWVIHLYADVLYNMSDIEFVFETPFESDRDIQFFLERAYNQTKATAEENLITQWFDVKDGVEDINYSVSSQGQGTALAITPKISVDKFEVNFINLESPIVITKGDETKYSFIWNNGYVYPPSEEEENDNTIPKIYIQYGIDGTDKLFFYDNRGGQLIFQALGIESRLTFVLNSIECGYCGIDELATMLGCTGVQIKDNEDNNYSLNKKYYVEIYKATSGKYTTLPCYSDINPSNKLLLPQGYQFILYNIDETTINMDNSTSSNLTPSPTKEIYNIETPWKLLSRYYYFETAFYNQKRQLSYNNILIEKKEDFFNILKNRGAQIESENKWQYDSINHRWYGSEPLFVKWEGYEVFKIKNLNDQQFYSYKNINDFIMIPYTEKEVINDAVFYYINPKEIALCRYDINSYLFNDSNIKNQIKRSSFLYLLDSNKVEVGKMGLETDKQYLDLEQDKTYYNSTGKQSINTKSLIDSGYNYIKIPRYKITEGLQEKYFKLLSIPNNRYSTPQSYKYDIDEGYQYYFNLNEQDSGLKYSETDKQINAKYWTASPQIYPEIVFNSTTSLENKNHQFEIRQDKIIFDKKPYDIYPNDVIVYYERNSSKVENILKVFDDYISAPWRCPGGAAYRKGVLFVTGEENSGEIKSTISTFKIDLTNQNFKFDQKINKHHWKEISINCFKKIIKTKTDEVSITITTSGIDYTKPSFKGKDVPAMLGIGTYNYNIGIYNYAISLYEVSNVTLTTPATFIFKLATNIEYITDHCYSPFSINNVAKVDNIMASFNQGGVGDVPTGSWTAQAEITSTLQPTWNGVIEGSFSFFGNTRYETISNTNELHSAGIVGESYEYFHKFRGTGKMFSEFRMGVSLEAPEPTSVCAIVIWRNGKLDPINPETPEGLLLKKENNEHYTVQGYFGSNENISIPTQYNNIPITAIETKAFESCDLTEISIPSSITKIGSNVFDSCKALKKIWISKSVENMGYQCFYDCDENLVIYCEAENQPATWDQDWNKGNYTVKWNSSFEDYQSA